MEHTWAPRRGGVRPSPVFVLFVGLAVAGGVLAARATTSVRLLGIGVFLLVVAGWVVTLCLHEFGHAYLAHRGGDTSVAGAGYLTLNPFRYAHPLLSIVLPIVFIALGGIGLPGGAVYLHPHALRSRARQTMVALAGPLANIAFAVALLAVVRHGDVYGPHTALWSGLGFLGWLQISAALLNLLPIPGLDGYAAIEPYLSAQNAKGFEPFKPFGMLLVFGLLQINSLSALFFGWVNHLYTLSGAEPGLVGTGLNLFRFWNLHSLG